jgi:hypothetical protein
MKILKVDCHVSRRRENDRNAAGHLDLISKKNDFRGFGSNVSGHRPPCRLV